MPSAAPDGMLQEVLHQRRRVLERHDRTGPLARVSQPHSTPALERHDIRSGDVPLQDVENWEGRYYWRTPQPRRAELQRQSREGRGRPETARDIENNVDYLERVEREYWEQRERDYWDYAMGPGGSESDDGHKGSEHGGGHEGSENDGGDEDHGRGGGHGGNEHDGGDEGHESCVGQEGGESGRGHEGDGGHEGDESETDEDILVLR